MTEHELKDTKEKIIEAGRQLFALKGFYGTSVREIAQQAEVNLAALNYHFSSKENLFRQIMEQIFLETQKAIQTHREECPDESVSDLSIWYFRYFLEKSDVLRSVFKMFLSEKHSPTAPLADEPFGPPGGSVFADAIHAELKRSITEQNMFWAVKVIFSHVIHTALMYSNHFCKLCKADQISYYSQPVLESDIRRLVKTVLGDL